MISANMRFDHLGIIVPNLQIGRNHFFKMYGINNWTDEFFDELNGVYVQFGQSKDKFCYELIAPINNKSPVYNVLSKKKNILNHIAYTVDAIDACFEELLSNQFVPLGEPNKAVAYSLQRVQFFYSKDFGYILELIEAPNFYHDYNPQTPT